MSQFSPAPQAQLYGMSQQTVINGNLDDWQYGSSFANPIYGSFTADRFFVSFLADGGTLPTTITHSRLLLTSGDIPGSFYGYRMNFSGAGSGFGTNSSYVLNHKIEFGTRYLCGAGKKVSFSFMAKSDIAGKRVGIGLLQRYGTGGSPTANEQLLGQIITLTTTWTRYTFTFTTNTLVGKTFGTNNDDMLHFQILGMWGTTVASGSFGGGTAESFVGSGNIDIAQIKVSADDTPSPSQPLEPSENLSKCQRFAIAYTDANTTFTVGEGSAASTTQAKIHVELPQQMRIAPATLIATATDWQLTDGVTTTDLTAISILSSSNKTVTLLCTVASGLTQFRPYQLVADGTANRLMLFTAEL